MAGRAPDLWAGVSAWCPVYDLKNWHAEATAKKLRYAAMVERSCGGAPGASAEVDEQYRVRSASAWLEKARGITNITISTGIRDGHQGSVPISHTLLAFNAVASPADQISPNVISRMSAKPKMPDDLMQTIDDPLQRRKPVLFRKTSGNARVTIFQGGHEIIYEAALAWLEQQRKGQPPVWDIRELPNVDLSKVDEKASK
jgi:hypothetical protein